MINVEHYPQIVLLFLGLGLLTSLSNWFLVRRFDQYPRARVFPRVSVLVPARNEQHNIGACLLSLLDQDYADYEVLALDDHSSDETRPILAGLARTFERLRVLDGKPLPEGWLGKHWACQQLSEAATGELLLFVDADTRHAPNTLTDSVSALQAENADLVTAFPREEVVTWGERLVVPVIGFGIFSFLPVALVRKLRLASFSVTIGQFMLFRRAPFEAIGGYASVRDHLVDDVELGRRLIRAGYAWRLMDGTAHVTCRMYNNFRETVQGFSKNIFAFFEYHVLLFMVTLLGIGLAFLHPAAVLVTNALGEPLRGFPPRLAVVAVGESLLLWGLAYRRFRLPMHLILLYPLSLLLFILIGFRSMLLTVSGQATWKDRELASPAWRWL